MNKRGSRRILLAFLLALGSLAAFLWAPSLVLAVPVPKLDWHRCASDTQKGFQCARTKVPEEYSHPHRSKLHLALIRHRATDPAHRIGTLFFNPGGPGPSIGSFPGSLQFFPASLLARFDIVTWDPRGTGKSTAVRCFASTKGEARFLGGVGGASFPVGKSQKRKWIGRFRGFGRRCEGANGDLLRHVSTADTARDLDRLRQAVGDRRLSYYGVSYGTFLGDTYANLFPERVRALVLDGNINPKVWGHRATKLNGGRFLGTFLRQHSDQGTVKTLNAFLDLCGQTDTAHCAFSAGSAAATRAKYDALLQRVRSDPASADISYADLASESLLFLTAPAAWTEAAGCLQQVWAEGRFCDLGLPAGRTEQSLAIMCAESPNPSPSAFGPLDLFAERRSGVAGRYKSWSSEACGSWPAAAADRYGGPWNRHTANPLLVIGNTHDPNTPYRSAKAVTRQLGRARLLTVDGYGHTEFTNPSTCARGYVGRYLIAKTLPPQGTRCGQDYQPFTGGP